MLPMTLQFIIVMIASAINDRLQRKLDYVEEERRILREQLDAVTGSKKIFFTAEQRRRLATAGKLLTPRRTPKMLLPREAGHNFDLVPPARREEVRQLRRQTRPPAQVQGCPQARH